MHKLLYFLILGILIHDSFAQEMPAKKLVSRTAIDLFYYGEMCTEIPLRYNMH
ncbi:hypothetical protein ACFFJX_19405 [Pseudarcicella hirudinis]|uniref:hypothetical protein n=1 Tax=Pseudarcicella hirudinis TaxID=1079859 RepID=UPI0035EA03BC